MNPRPSFSTMAKKADRERLDLRIEPDIRNRADAQARRYGLSLSAYIRRAMIEVLERDEASQHKPPPDQD